VAHLKLIREDEAHGLLKEEYDAAMGRAGKVFNIVKAMTASRRGGCGRSRISR